MQELGRCKVKEMELKLSSTEPVFHRRRKMPHTGEDQGAAGSGTEQEVRVGVRHTNDGGSQAGPDRGGAEQKDVRGLQGT
ncbi:unnamed protein product [Closterium sp. NIES-53]